jgi:YidC/Oxa1 family membrane protein insertase
LKELGEKYKDDKELHQKKMMEFYKVNKINPAGGCLPMLIQLPILFALFGTFTGPPFGTKQVDVKVNVVEQKQSTEAKKNEVSGGNSPYVSRDGGTAKVVVFPGDMTVVKGDAVDFGVRAVQGDLPAAFQAQWRVFPKNQREPMLLKATDADGYHVQFNDVGEYHVSAGIPGIARDESFGFIHSLGKVAKGADLLKPANYDSTALILLFGLTMFLSTKFSGAGPIGGNDDEMTEQQKVQRDSMKVMPLTVTAMFFFIPLPTGVYLYMVVSNILQTMQTYLVMKTTKTTLVDVSSDAVDVSSDGTVTISKKGNTYSAGSDDNSNGNGSEPGVIISTKKKKKKR